MKIRHWVLHYYHWADFNCFWTPCSLCLYTFNLSIQTIDFEFGEFIIIVHFGAMRLLAIHFGVLVCSFFLFFISHIFWFITAQLPMFH